jgi:microcystin-dependent protein
MSSPFLSEIRMVAFNFPPKGWAFCDGQTLSIQQNAALFALLGTTYGGNGQTTFNLPDLQGRSPMHFGSSNQLSLNLGQSGGEPAHTLLAAELPTHSHTLVGSDAAANTADPTRAYLADGGNSNYGAPASVDGSLAPSTLLDAGGSQPHENEQPYLVINFVIALQGIFPSRN